MSEGIELSGECIDIKRIETASFIPKVNLFSCFDPFPLEFCLSWLGCLRSVPSAAAIGFEFGTSGVPSQIRVTLLLGCLIEASS